MHPISKWQCTLSRSSTWPDVSSINHISQGIIITLICSHGCKDNRLLCGFLNTPKYYRRDLKWLRRQITKRLQPRWQRNSMQERLPLRLPWLHSGNKTGHLVRHVTTVMFVKDHSAVSSRWWKDISAFCKPAINICRWEQSYMNRLHNRIVLRISFNISFAHNTCVPDQGYEFVWKYRFRHARMKFPY